MAAEPSRPAPDAEPARAAPAAPSPLAGGPSGAGWREVALAPLRTRIFLSVWVASLASNFGTLIQSVGAAWLMTSLTRQSDMVALVQAATALPIVLLSMPAGAIADIWDRRALMLLAQLFMVTVAVILTVLAFAGGVTPWVLLGLTFLLGCGSAMYGPAWQSSVGEQVPREHLPAAVALNSLGFNIARTTGPALGGAIVAVGGAAWAFLFNAVSYLGLIFVLARWKRPVQKPTLPPEGIGNAMTTGLRYVRLSPVIRTVLARAFVFGLLGSAIWALMPLVARDLIRGGPLTFGLLLGAFGGGAVVGALFSTALRHKYVTETIVSAGTATFGLATLVVAFSPWLALSMLALVAAGAAWVLTLSTFNITTQTSAPRWVVGRALAVYQMAAFGGMAAGSWTWGLYAEHGGLVHALAASGALLVVSVALARLLPLRPFEELVLDPLRGPAELHDHRAVAADAGPVVITVGYRVRREDWDAFTIAMHELGRVRRRDGAHRWRLMQDVDDAEWWTERWQHATWLDHLRSLHRATVADRPIRERARAFHRGPEPPKVRHMLERSPDEARERLEHAAGRDDGARTDVVRVAPTDPSMPGDQVPGAARTAGG
jgi:MFS family permease